MTMFNFKGIRAYYFIVMMVVLTQMFKVIGFIKSMEGEAILAVVLTIGLTIKLVVFDKKFRDAKYWLLFGFMLVQEIIIGLDRLLPDKEYSLTVSLMLAGSICILYYFDAPSVRKHMDDDAYILKNTCSMYAFTYSIAVCDILFNYMFPPHLPM